MATHRVDQLISFRPVSEVRDALSGFQIDIIFLATVKHGREALSRFR